MIESCGETNLGAKGLNSGVSVLFLN